MTESSFARVLDTKTGTLIAGVIIGGVFIGPTVRGVIQAIAAAASKDSLEDRSTTSSAGGGASAYETRKVRAASVSPAASLARHLCPPHICSTRPMGHASALDCILPLHRTQQEPSPCSSGTQMGRTRLARTSHHQAQPSPPANPCAPRASTPLQAVDEYLLFHFGDDHLLPYANGPKVRRHHANSLH